jgi:predicted nucleic acid-binding protein
MKSFLLDTNVISELRKPKPHGGLKAWFDRLQLNQIFLSAVTLGELQAGVEITRVQDIRKAQEIEKWIDALSHTVSILEMNAACFREWAHLMHGKSHSISEDAMIAATARIHNLIVATRNESDFRQFDVAIYNPFHS